jgi:hypothetical protein
MVGKITDKRLWEWLSKPEDFSKSSRINVPIPTLISRLVDITVGSCDNDKALALFGSYDDEIVNIPGFEVLGVLSMKQSYAAVADIPGDRIYEGLIY